MRRRGHGPAVLILVGLWAAGARAEAPGDDVLDWAPAGTHALVVLRGADALADLADHVATRFGRVGSVARAVESVRAWRVGGVRPSARDWGPGLALGRGVAVFVRADETFRLVVGADDPSVAVGTLAAHLRALGAEAKSAPGGLRLGDVSLRCEGRGDFLVCDHAIVPATPSKPPDWLAAAPVDRGGLLLVHLRGAALARLTGAPALEDLWVAARREGDAFELVGHATPAPFLREPLAQIGAPDGPGRCLALVDRSSRSLLKISVDAEQLLTAASGAAGPVAPGAKALVEALRRHWSGELVLAADGGVTHPVLLVGLRAPGSGEALVRAAVDAMAADGVAARLTDAPGRAGAVKVIEIPVGDDVRVRLPWAVADDVLVVALAAEDVARRVGGRVRPATRSDPALAEPGVSGVVLGGLPGGLLVPWMRELVAADGELALLLDNQVIGSVLAELVDEVGFWVRPRPDAIRARLWWRTL